jgi:hypothetical protein
VVAGGGDFLQCLDNEGVFSGRPTKNFSLACQKNFLLMLAIFSLNSSNVLS